MSLALIVGTGISIVGDSASANASTTPTKVEVHHKWTQADVNAAIDNLAPQYGLSAELVKSISQCEDGGNPYATGTAALIGVDIGPLQINSYYHQDEMEKMGLDIHDPQDNLRYGMRLMEEQGTRPWKWSQHCWDK